MKGGQKIAQYGQDGPDIISLLTNHLSVEKNENTPSTYVGVHKNPKAHITPDQSSSVSPDVSPCLPSTPTTVEVSTVVQVESLVASSSGAASLLLLQLPWRCLQLFTGHRPITSLSLSPRV